jgi:hypothetical protein
MSQPGLGVMIQMLGGNEESSKIVQESIGKKIKSLSLDDNSLRFVFEDGSTMRLSDEGQSCCESRYLTFEGNLEDYVGAEFKMAKFRDEYDGNAEYNEHEIQPVEIETDKGSFIVEHHNEHNGYYGGFWIVASR